MGRVLACERNGLQGERPRKNLKTIWHLFFSLFYAGLRSTIEIIHFPDSRIGARSHTKVVTYSHFWVMAGWGLAACVEFRFVIARRNGGCADVEPSDFDQVSLN